MKVYVTIFATVLLAELGDKTQLATVLFAANPGVNRWLVFGAAAGALVVSTALAVVVGSAVGMWIPPRTLRLLAGVGFVAIGVWILMSR